MPDLLLELFSEEIPARMQRGAARDLERLMVGALSDRGLLFEGIMAFCGPRRLTLAITGLPARQRDVHEEIKGPKVDAPPAAINGFLRKTGLTTDQLKVEKTPRGDVYLAVIERSGRETAAVLAEIIPDALGKLPWPKSMRWIPGVSTRWVRPLHAILATFDGAVVPFTFAGVASGTHTYGHRFLSQDRIEARHFEDYERKLRAAHVILDADERADVIRGGLKEAAFVHGLEMVPDDGLLAEVSGLAEWPVVLVGMIEEQFMDVPPEILRTAMRTHQKYFSLHDPKTGTMANRFALVTNMVAADGGREIVAGNERVLRARLADARFFWDEDRKRSLESRVGDLKGVVFHAKLGTQYERAERISALAGEVAGMIGADIEKAKRAALLAKADLTTGVVGEFPELQGVMGRYYALHDGEDADVADAIRDHYRPVGPSDAVPTDKVAISVALADKLDQLVGFFAVGERPTGSGDPYALRRAALGILRIIDANGIPLELCENDLLFDHLRRFLRFKDRTHEDAAPILEAVAVFLRDRLEVLLKEQGTPIDIVRAAFGRAMRGFKPVDLTASALALQKFLETDDGTNLLAGYKRAANILKAEEKKDKKSYSAAVDASLLSDPAGKALFAPLQETVSLVSKDVDEANFQGAMQKLAALRGPVDAFFEGVKVNADDPAIRANRLGLLALFRQAVHTAADFSRIEG